jgi:uncharacterized paraquat-inducible protein A
MEQVAPAVTTIIILFLPFVVKISDNNKSILNVMINVRTTVMLTETKIPFSLNKTNSSTCGS